jgi:hypothetical protein
MPSIRPFARAGAALAAGGLVLGLTAIPAGSQVVASSSLAVTGTVECQVAGDQYTWVVAYEATNTSQIAIPAGSPAALGDIDITAENLSLDAVDLGPIDLQPNPVPVGETATDGGPIPGDVTGNLVLTVDWASSDTEDSGTEVVTLVLDNSCQAPVTTTTAGPAVQADVVAVSPAFTG